MPHAASVAATVIIQAWTWALPTAVTVQTGGDERCKRMRFRIAKVRKKTVFCNIIRPIVLSPMAIHGGASDEHTRLGHANKCTVLFHSVGFFC